ncbi:hypothetical protein SAMN04488096_1273 [Mesonia phycicola]|uniref:Uncharacterized protein n=1 Tax=Mesonia phycicola TaxID=579105 RepID=A0A1M6HWQ7_9FLAO|nr:hypothetical protein [Mesonia phycicola]SHJ26700.1 hypothetical protein SAMN04488096_1273 [Mesonia phycicola]
MNKSNKIVRTKTTHGNKNKPLEVYYEIEFMTFSNYISKLNPDIILTDYKFEIYPYKWYDLRWIYEIPAYWLLLRIFRNSPERINKQTHNKISKITLITEILVMTTSIIELIKLFISYN